MTGRMGLAGGSTPCSQDRRSIRTLPRTAARGPMPSSAVSPETGTPSLPLPSFGLPACPAPLPEGPWVSSGLLSRCSGTGGWWWAGRGGPGVPVRAVGVTRWQERSGADTCWGRRAWQGGAGG